MYFLGKIIINIYPEGVGVVVRLEKQGPHSDRENPARTDDSVKPDPDLS